MLTNTFLSPEMLMVFYKLAGAMLCGVILGTERIISHKAAGTRTYALVSMGSALFIILGDIMLRNYISTGLSGIDPFHIPAAIISGIGFMGAGVIILRGSNVTGLTTASGLWVAAGIGAACGYGLFVPAVMATLLTLFIFVILWQIEQRIKKIVPEPQVHTEE